MEEEHARDASLVLQTPTEGAWWAPSFHLAELEGSQFLLMKNSYVNEN